NGTIIGEGAGFVVLERLSSARERGVRPLAILSGWALGTDAHSRAAGDASGAGLARVAKTALERAGLDACDIGYANLHGTGTVVNDLLEAAAMRELGPAAATIPCSSTKPVTGHCLGATSAMEVILCIKALEERVLPPSANCQQVDPACARLRLIEKALAAPDIRHAISLSSGFWSNHAALIVSAWQP
ncbi:MAG TPA: hypothetical protein VK968_08410, partial [Roseimicrobium sp.]|nr:hypothetical protein [Roseimicrobium sp.]